MESTAENPAHFDNEPAVVYSYNMKAELLIRERETLDNGVMEIVVWELPRKLAGSSHNYKYRLALVINGKCVMRYDNEVGRGDHKHIGKKEYPYNFKDVDTLIADFQLEAERWLK